MANDEDVVRENYLATVKSDRDKSWAPKISEMDAQLRALSMIHDRLGDVTQAVLSTIQVGKGKTPPRYKGKPFPQPTTLLDEIKEQESRETGAWLVQTFMPHAAGGWSDN